MFLLRDRQLWCFLQQVYISLQRRLNKRDGVSNHQPPECLLKRLLRLVTSGFHTQRPVTRKMFPFDDVIMFAYSSKK